MLSTEATAALSILAAGIDSLPLAAKVAALNEARAALHAISPFRHEPVDYVEWVGCETVCGNDYNPNRVAPPEFRLLALSINSDGYTQPIVTAQDDGTEVVDGFHRTQVGKGDPEVRQRVHGYLPIVRINPERGSRADRIASTIRHNRARGKHGVEAMSRIVAELAKRNWPDEKIGRELGMEPDEVLRLKQITGLAEMFANREFSMAWEPAEAEE